MSCGGRWRGRVRGIRNPRVIDVSIFPDITSVATNITTMVAAEHIAERVTA
jgi:choline dehydrogenase